MISSYFTSTGHKLNEITLITPNSKLFPETFPIKLSTKNYSKLTNILDMPLITLVNILYLYSWSFLFTFWVDFLRHDTPWYNKFHQAHDNEDLTDAPHFEMFVWWSTQTLTPDIGNLLVSLCCWENWNTNRIGIKYVRLQDIQPGAASHIKTWTALLHLWSTFVYE